MKFLDDDQAQSEALYNFWQTHKVTILVSLLVLFSSLWAFTTWQQHQRQHKEQATMAFYQWSKTDLNNPTTMVQGAKNIMHHFPSSPYASWVKLMLAKHAIETQHPDEAIRLYQRIIEQPKHEEIRLVAAFRLAELYLNQKQPKQALKVLETHHKTWLSTRFDALKADAYMQLHAYDKAHDLYQSAIDACPKTPIWQTYCQQLALKKTSVYLKPISHTPASQKGRS